MSKEKPEWISRFERPKTSVITAIYIWLPILIFIDALFLTGTDFDVYGIRVSRDFYTVVEFALIVIILIVGVSIGVMRLFNYKKINEQSLLNIVILYFITGLGLILLPDTVNTFWMVLLPIGFLSIVNYGFKAVMFSTLYTGFLLIMFYLVDPGNPTKTTHYFAFPILLFASLQVANIFRESIIKAYEASQKANTELKDEYQKTQTLINNIRDAALTLDKNLHVKVFNEAFLDMVNQDQIKADTNIDDILKLHDVEKGLIGIKDLVAAKEFSYEAQFFDPEERMLLDYEVSISIIRDHTGDVQGYSVLLHDITQQKKIDRKKDEFISVATHELRTPMTIINGHATILSKGKYGKLNKKQKYYVDRIRDSAVHLIKLVGDMLDISKLESIEVPSKDRTHVHVEDLAETQIEAFNELCIQNNITLTADVEPGLRIFANPGEIKQVFTNLLGNAFKYTPNGGNIVIGAQTSKKDRNMAQLSVKDSGVGIGKKDQEMLFQKFSQVDSVLQREADGTGLGLVIVKQIVTQHGGKVWVESEKHEGTTFLFTVPTDKESKSKVKKTDEDEKSEKE